jgi:polyisoprenoid-binding protein YceI
MKKSIILIIALVLFSLNAFASEFHVDKSQKRQMQFFSKMTLEDFDGKTEKIDGFLNDNQTGLLNSNFYFEVDMNSIKTYIGSANIGLMDRHMYDMYLHTKKYPKSAFKGTITAVNGNDVIAEGDFNLHGTVKKVKFNGTVVSDGNGGYSVKVKFAVKMPDYKIETPSYMLAKVNEKIDIVVEFMLKKVK